MIIYFVLYFFLLSITFFKYKKSIAYWAYLPIFAMLAFKGEVGCDYWGYMTGHYLNFNPNETIFELRGELTWYMVEYFVYYFDLGYQFYYIFSAIIGVFFLLLAQKHVKSLYLLVLLYPIIFIQLGLSGIRQFLAVCVALYILSRYLFTEIKSIYPYLFYTGVAMSFHISAVMLLLILPFIVKVRPVLILIFSIIGLVVLITGFGKEVYSIYEFRYFTRTRESSGAWIRFGLTSFILLFILFNKRNQYKWLPILLLFLGLSVGKVNSIALHRLNYFFYVFAILLLLRSALPAPRRRFQLQFIAGLALSYMMFWFTFSTHTHCIVPYTFFFF